MDDLVNKVWRHYDKHQFKDYVVTPSIPILYFGNTFKYQNSKHKIVTVGLNPSKEEFPINDKRFKLTRDKKAYLSTLDNYFNNKPYEKWFNSFSSILSGLNASFYPHHNKSIGIHTDICTPLATNPTWSLLEKQQQDQTEELSKEGYPLWSNLIKILEPDIIICSIAKKHLRNMSLYNKQELLVLGEKKDGSIRKKPYIVEAYTFKLDKNHAYNLFFGEAANTPFGTLANNDKKKVGEAIFAYIKGKS